VIAGGVLDHHLSAGALLALAPDGQLFLVKPHHVLLLLVGRVSGCGILTVDSSVTVLPTESAVLLCTFGTAVSSFALIKTSTVVSSSTVGRGTLFESFYLLKMFPSPFIVHLCGFSDPFLAKLVDGTQLRTVLVEFQSVVFAIGVRTLDDFVSSI